MYNNKHVIVVMPAYNAEGTLSKTVSEIPDWVDTIIVVDDFSRDGTEQIAKGLNLIYFRHNNNLGYGANQKTCYKLALDAGADIVVMVHPDYQYSPRLVEPMAAMLTSGHYDIILASRIIGDQRTRRHNMPVWRYISNRILTLIQNVLLHYKLSEYHTGYRAYTRKVLENLDTEKYSNDFIFDNQLLIDAVLHNFSIGEISCPTVYDAESSSINFSRSVKYGFGVIYYSLRFRLYKMGLLKSVIN